MYFFCFLYQTLLLLKSENEVVTVGLPERLVGDRADDSDPLDDKLAADGIELIAPHRSTARNLPRKTAAYCVATSGDGRSNGCLHG